MTAPATTDDPGPATEALEPRERTLGIMASVLLVLGVFVFAQVPIAIGFASAPPPSSELGIAPYVSFFDADSWGRYDSWLYLDIAKAGYALEPCEADSLWGTKEWCGNAGWLPGYPMLVRAGTYITRAEKQTVGVWLPRLFTLGIVAALWVGCLGRRFNRRSLGSLLLASVWPGAIYLYAMFPMSLVALATIGTALLLVRDRPLLAGACTTVVAVSHTTGLYVPVLAAAWLAIEHRRDAWRGARRVAVFLSPVAVGVLIMLGFMQIQTGHWDAVPMTYHKYGHHLQFPPTYLFHRISDVWDHAPGTSRWPSIQALAVAVMVVAICAAAVVNRRRLQPLERLLLVLGVGLWIAPLTYGGEQASVYRLEVLILPAAVVARRLPAAALYPMVAACFVVAVAMTRLFLTGTLV